MLFQAENFSSRGCVPRARPFFVVVVVVVVCSIHVPRCFETVFCAAEMSIHRAAWVVTQTVRCNLQLLARPICCHLCRAHVRLELNEWSTYNEYCIDVSRLARLSSMYEYFRVYKAICYLPIAMIIEPDNSHGESL